jgi:O-antigen biosynthesis protein
MAVELSVIVPCRGHAAELEVCLSSLVAQNTSLAYEVLVVYCSQEFDVDSVVKKFPSVLPVISENFLLPGEARNEGARNARGEYFAFIDADCWVDPDWVTFAYETLWSGAVLCGGAILDFQPWNLVASADNRLQFADFPKGRPYGVATYLPGPNIAVRKETFSDMEGFSSHNIAQDVLLTMRIAERWPEKTIFNPQMVVRHFGRSGWRGFLDHQKIFGLARAEAGVQVGPTLAWFARRPYFGWVVFLRRLLYISFRVAQWNFFDIPRYMLQFPLVLAGLAYWVAGFYQGFSSKKKG